MDDAERKLNDMAETLRSKWDKLDEMKLEYRKLGIRIRELSEDIELMEFMFQHQFNRTIK